MEHGLINDIAICIVVAWILAFAAQLLKQPLILAYLAAGFTVGPIGSSLVDDRTSIETISSLGLVLLLFMIGLEIDLKKMLGAGRAITSTALAQLGAGAAGGVLLFSWLGFPLHGGNLDALYLGITVALSSTVIVVKILYDRRELDTLPGRVTLGIMVLQDLFAIMFLALQPNLGNPTLAPIFWSFFKVLLLVAVAFTASRYALPVLFRSVARLPELVLVGALAWCFLISGLASVLGLSREMGALVAGMAISTFPYTIDVVAKVTSIRDFFVTLFFVALGMQIPQPSWSLLGHTVILIAFLVASRMLTVFPVLYALGLGHRASFLPAIHLAQLSELSLVILSLGLHAGHVSKSTTDAAAYAFAILAVCSSYAIARAGNWVPRLSPWLSRIGLPDLSEDAQAKAGDHPKPSVFLLGFSWTASSLLEEIEQRMPDLLPHLCVVDFNPEVNHKLKDRQINVIYGDISQLDTLVHAGVADAQIIVCTLPNIILKGVTNLRLVQQLRSINTNAQIIMHAELLDDVPKLYAAGASYVSVPRLLEARDLCEVIDAARNRLLEEKRMEHHQILTRRNEIIP